MKSIRCLVALCILCLLVQFPLGCAISSEKVFVDERQDEKPDGAIHQSKESNDIIDWFGRGNYYYILGRYDEAIEAYRQYLRIDPEYAQVWSGLGKTYFMLKRYDDAINAYREAIRIDPEEAFAWRVLGGAYYFSGNRTGALDAYKELRRLDPASADELFDMIVPK